MQRRLILAEKLSNSSTISTRIPMGIHKKILETVIQDGYGMRGKNRWIIEAIYNFLSLPNYPELVEAAKEMEELTEALSIRVTRELATAIKQAIIFVRKYYPAMEGVQSHILRASVMQRLILSETNDFPVTENCLKD